MKILTLLLSLLFISQTGIGQLYTAATYNLRLNIESDGINKWDKRKEWLTDQLKEINPDILGTQEGLAEQIDYLDQKLDQHHYVGVARKDGNKNGEYTAIFYNRDTFELIENGTFWLSETQDTASVGWDAALERICTYALLFDKTNDQYIWVFNAHLDHVGEQSRSESLKLIWKTLQQKNSNQYPALVMGDFNAVPISKPISFLTSHLNDSKSVSISNPLGPDGTYNGFDTTHPLDRRIDYIFVNNKVTVQEYTVLNDIQDNRTPSDHLPVIINFSLK